ncbi:MAG: SDR family NAD(P)-dependent oxidoreductase, partial [Actinomycetota bacterium]|nr:SDR family NAD(P)-dependent oxidoreductase [Actinomycetota bacterium]
MDLGLAGKVALVTGASKGLGFAIASELAREGATVAITSRSEERITAAAHKIGARGFVHDTGNSNSAPDLIARVEQDLGPVDILVTNSGGPPASEDALSFELEQWRAAYELLLLGAIALVRSVLPGMRERGWGRVISVSSAVVREPSPTLALSASHRAGLLAALKTIARQVGGDGVTINSLLTGVIATDRSHELDADRPDRIAQIPAGRLGTVEEFAAAAAFL